MLRNAPPIRGVHRAMADVLETVTDYAKHAGMFSALWTQLSAKLGSPATLGGTINTPWDLFIQKYKTFIGKQGRRTLD